MVNPVEAEELELIKNRSLFQNKLWEECRQISASIILMTHEFSPPIIIWKRYRERQGYFTVVINSNFGRFDLIESG